MFDIASLAVADTTAIHVKGPDGDYLYSGGKPVRIIIYGPGSKQFAEIEARQSNRAVKRMNENDGKVTLASPEQRAAETAEDLAAITVEFENFSYSPAGDKKGQELFQAVYLDPKLGFIPPQVLKAVRDWGNFKPASPTS